MYAFGESERVRRHLEARVNSPRVLVLGDLMLDRYLHGDADRISPEAPVPVVRVRRETFVAGGAANVALNLSRLGAETIVLGYVGSDTNAEKLQSVLDDTGIAARLVRPAGFPTVTKTRVLGGHQQMIRIDMEEPDHVGAESEDALLSAFQEELARGADAVLLSDYAKGVLTRSTCERAIAAAKAAGVPTFVDPKGMDYSPYAGATCISPNRKELAAAVHHPESDLIRLLELGGELRAKLDVEYLLATLGDQGMALIGHDHTVRYPTQAREVFDVSGAGDTVIATLAFAVGAGFEMTDAVRLANSAAGYVVGKLGTYAISREELFKVLEAEDSAHAEAPLGRDGLAKLAEAWKAANLEVIAIADRFDVVDLRAISSQRTKHPGAKLIAVVLAAHDEEARAQSRGATLLTVPEIDAVAIVAESQVQQTLDELGIRPVGGLAG